MKQTDISSATRLAILDAAGQIILEKGIEALTLDAAAQQAGLSKGGLLYHFPTKKKLFEALIQRQIDAVDASLEDELGKNGGDYLAAYIRASFVFNPEQNKISFALLAAVVNEPDLLKPLRARFYKMQEEMAAAAATPELGTIIRLALDGMWISDVFDYAPPSLEMRSKMAETLFNIAKRKN
jgi:AcrR family transcriptional regulator